MFIVREPFLWLKVGSLLKGRALACRAKEQFASIPNCVSCMPVGFKDGSGESFKVASHLKRNSNDNTIRETAWCYGPAQLHVCCAR